MNILILAHFSGFEWEGVNDRFGYLLDVFDSKKNNIHFVTSKFFHEKKTERSIPDNIKRDYKITLIDEPPYKKNVSLKRIYSHHIAGKNLTKYLKTLTYKPDVIYCSVPSLDFASAALKYAKKNKIRFIIDVQDLWPEAFSMALDIPVISDILFYPMLRKANKIYKGADEVVAVSETYVDRSLKVNKKCKDGLSIFLGTDLKYFDECKKKNRIYFNDNIIRIVYCGTLGTSYDIKSIILAIKKLNNKKIKFIVIGDGPLEQEFINCAIESGINYEFTGRIPYDKMVGLLCSCDIAVNPIIGKSVASIINKVGDYAASGLPVINTQNSDEYRKLLDEYEAGLNCENGNINDIARKIEKLVNDKKLRLHLGKGNRRLALEKFDREKTYKKIVDVISKEV